MSDPIYCGLAFGSVSMGNQGQLRPCCGIVPNAFDSNATISSQPISVRINNKELREVRKQLIAGEWPKACASCKDTESIGSESMRLIWNKNIDNAPMSETINPSDVKYLDLSVGNKCNSKCMTCNPYCSDFWIEEYSYNTSTKNTFSWSTVNITEQSIDEFFDTFKNVEFVNLLGGEPMFSPGHIMLLKKLVSSGASKNITLNYVSNLTVFDDSLVDIWKDFKSVGASLSMDGLGLVNDYLRYPAKFDKIEQNLKNYIGLVSSGQFGMTLSYTVSLFNITRYPEVLEYYVDLITKFDVGDMPMAIYLNYVNSPEYFSSSMLSREFRMSCLEKLSNVRQRIESMNVHPSLLESCNMLYSWATTPQIYDRDKIIKAVQFINLSDRYRNRHIKDYIPDVWEELNKLLIQENKDGK